MRPRSQAGKQTGNRRRAEGRPEEGAADGGEGEGASDPECCRIPDPPRRVKQATQFCLLVLLVCVS